MEKKGRRENNMIRVSDTYNGRAAFRLPRSWRSPDYKQHTVNRKEETNRRLLSDPMRLSSW